jgi:ATP-dependent helicase/nuclease subunit A
VSGSDPLRSLDAEARSRAQREFRRPLVLEAGAGTGKTATLVARVLAWCLGPGWDAAAAQLLGAHPVGSDRLAARTLSRVVAITFTEAAAAEMAARVEQALVAVETGEPVVGLDEATLPDPGLRQQRAAALRDGLEHLVVQTLHAFARRLLAAHPFEAGLHPQLEVDAEGEVQRAVVRRVLETRLREAYAQEGDALALAASGHGPHELELELLALLESGVSARDLAGDPLAAEKLRALFARLRGGLEAFREASGDRLHAASRSPLAVQAAQLVDDALALSSAEDAGTLADLAALVAANESAARRLRDWAKDRFNQQEQRVLADRREQTVRAAAGLAPLLAHLGELDPEALARAQRVLAPLLAEVEEALDRRGFATFASLLSRAARLVELRPDVARDLRRDIDQLLVDEFQDTDPLQCALVGALALDGDPAERPGLLLVGDPKQSIYGWRDADLAAYEEFVARALACGGELHRLSVNHRSLPAVLAEVERVIAPVMRREAGVQPAFEPLVPNESNASRSFEDSKRFAGVEHWIAAPWQEESGEVGTGTASAATRLEAGALAADLLALQRERGVPWRSIGVLFRSRGDWDVYLSALREAGVPFSVEGDRSYYRRREIIEAAAWVRCVLDPHDLLALVATLRSAAVGVPDAAWVPLFSRGLPERVAELASADADGLAALCADAEAVAAALPRDIPGLSRIAGWQRNLVAALSAIGELREAFTADPADVFVEKLRASLLLEATEAARFLGPWRVANLERFFRDLCEELAAGADTQDVLRRLRHAVAEEEEMEEEPPHDTAADAVQILTLHGAKGLDFDHVYLMQLHKGTGQRPGPRIDAARVGNELELRLLGVPSIGFDRVVERRARVSDAERVRLLYVGMTRARERLVLSGAWPAFLQTRRADTHAVLLEQRRDLPDLPAVLGEAGRAGRAAVDVSGARFVLPALRDASPPPPEEIATRGSAAEPRAGEVSLPVLQQEAEARMARPLGGRASDTASDDPEERAARLCGQPQAGSLPADVARQAGIAVHRVFEELDLDVPVAESLRDPGARIREALGPRAAENPAVVEEAGRIFDGLAGGELLSRLERLRHHVVARELPVLLTPGPEDAALGFVAGSIDLVARDPDDGAWVVIDFKTDSIPNAHALAARTSVHARQGAAYQRALREGLSLPSDPRLELWFLRLDRRVSPGTESGRAPEQMSLTLG